MSLCVEQLVLKGSAHSADPSGAVGSGWVAGDLVSGRLMLCASYAGGLVVCLGVGVITTGIWPERHAAIEANCMLKVLTTAGIWPERHAAKEVN